MEIRIDRGGEVPIYRQISQALRERILRGHLPPGFRLPPERALALQLGVNRATVLSAYRELKGEGLVGGRVGHGTTVLGRLAQATADGVAPLRWSDFVRPGAAQPLDQGLREFLALSESSGVIVLSSGFPALELTPAEELRATLEAVIAERGSAALFYAPTEGVSSFREALTGLMASRGVACSPEEVLVTSGSQQALDLVARAFLEPGDTVIVEEPTYFGALQTFRAARARILGLPMDAEGPRPDALEHLLTRQAPKLVYLLPTFQNPSGCLTTLPRRQALLELAHRHRVPVLEDDSYSDLSYEGPPPPPIRSLDRHGFVLYVSSFSKVMCPGLRVGWIVAPPPVVRALARLKQTADLQSPTLSQMALERLLRDGGYARHAGRLRSHYARRHAAMEAALREEAAGLLRWSTPRGGSYFWCRLETPVPESALATRAAEEGVSFLPGALCFAQEPPASHLRLSFSFPTPEQIREGVGRLSRAVRSATDQIVAAAPAGSTRPLV